MAVKQKPSVGTFREVVAPSRPSPLDLHDWIVEIGDDDAAMALADPYDIRYGLPKLAESRALHHFFPNLSRGVPLKNGRILLAEAGNTDATGGKFAPDIVIRFKDSAPTAFEALVDIERKTNSRLFQESLPIDVPVLTFSAHLGRTPYTWPDGRWRLAGKIRYFLQHPKTSHFLAVSPDGQRGMMVFGDDIVAHIATPSWIRATGPPPDGFHAHDWSRKEQILVVRIPRHKSVIPTRANPGWIEDWVMKRLCVVWRDEEELELPKPILSAWLPLGPFSLFPPMGISHQAWATHHAARYRHWIAANGGRA